MRARRAATGLAGALFVTVGSAPGRAQQPRSDAPPASAQPGAASEAEARFLAGQKLYEDKQYGKALVELRASHAGTPSPNSRLYIARCLRGAGKTAEAVGEYTQVILEAAERLGADARYEATLRAAATERAALAGAADRAPRPSAATFAAAEARFFAGQRLYEDKQYGKALVELQASHEAAPSPNSLLYIARCHRGTGRVVEAFDEYALVALEAAERLGSDAKYEATLRAAATERAALKDRIATLVLEIPPGVAEAKLFVDADEVPASRWSGEIAVPPGEVKVRAEAPGRAPFEQSLVLAGGDQQRVTVELPLEAPAVPASLRPLAYAVAGVGAVGFVVWGVLGLKASSRYGDLLRQCGGRCPPSFQSQVDAGRRETTGSRAGLVVGIVGVAGGATMGTIDLLLRRREARREPSALRIAPSPFGPGVVAGGDF
jgi:tetratricopeptide (TPR) repeat protein